MRFSTAVRATAAAVAAVLALTPPAHAFDAHTFRDKQGDVKAGPGAKKWMKRTTDIRRVRVADLGKDVQVRFRVTNLVLPRPDASGPPTSFTASTKIKTNETLFARIEIYPDGTVIDPGEGEVQASMHREQPQALFPFHLLLSLDVDPAKVERIGQREGWRTLRCWRGPPGHPCFELIEFWIENRLMIEIATPEMLPNYVALATTEAHDRFLSGRAAPEPEPV